MHFKNNNKVDELGRQGLRRLAPFNKVLARQKFARRVPPGSISGSRRGAQPDGKQSLGRLARTFDGLSIVIKPRGVRGPGLGLQTQP